MNFVEIGNGQVASRTFEITGATLTEGDLTETRFGNERPGIEFRLWPAGGLGSRMTACNATAATGAFNCSGNVQWYSVPNRGQFSCQNKAETIALVSRMVGMTYRTGWGEPTTWAFACRAYGVSWATQPMPITAGLPPPSCTANTALLTLKGLVGERLRDTTDLQIHCDRTASVRLSIQNRGVVSIGGEGEVLLTFQTNGSDVLNVSGTDPQVSISGELTKSPTTAGTYRAATVLRLDIL